MKYLSKLLSMFLVGSMLWTVGCAKYDDEIQDLNNKIQNVQTSMDEKFAEVENNLGATQTELNELAADIETNKSDLADLTKAYEDLLKRLKDVEDEDFGKQITDAIKDFNDAVADLETMDNAFKDQLSDIEKQILDAVNTLTNQDNKNADAISDVKNALDDYKALVSKKIEDLEKRIEDAEKLLAEIQDEIAALSEQLAGLIQNITFIPEYTDGLATAVRVVGPKGTSLTATTLTAVFEITPASATNVLAEYGCVAIEPLKTRAEVLKGGRLAIEEIEGQPGRVKVTAFVHNMPADYNSYAFTLNVDVEGNTVASSDYVYIHENDDPEYQYVLVTEDTDESIEKHPNWDAEREALVFENKWTNASDEPINALEGYVYKLTNDGQKFYTLAEIEQKFGMSENALAVTHEVVISEEHAEFVTATADALIDMAYDNEYAMYKYINDEAEIDFSADNNAFLKHVVKAYYKVMGADVVDGAFIIEEVGDLYWLSQNQDYVFSEKKASKVIFAENVELDMAGYCSADSENAPYKAISPVTVVSIEGNGAQVKNLVVNGVESVGLFGYIKGNVSDLSVVNAKITGNHWVGGITGRICGYIKNCHVDGAEIVATANIENGAYDNGDKVGGIVGYSEPNSANTPAEPIEGCSVKNADIVAFRDLGGIVGAMYYGNDNLKNNSVANVNITAVQRDSQTPGYHKDANLGRILGRDLMQTWNETEYASNSVAGADLRIRYAIGAEVNVNSFDPKEHTLEISTANGMAWFSQNVTNPLYYNFEKVVLVNDIDFNNQRYFEDDKVTFVGINNNAANGSRRMFEFDGMNMTIRNFTWEENKKNIALFDVFVGDIKNIRMENVVLKGKGRVAPIAAQCWGHIDNCHVKNLDITVFQNAEDGDKLGGIVAQMQADGQSGTNNLITNCSVTNAEIEGYRDLGGLAGHADLKEYDNSNKFENVVIWVNQLFEGYEAGHYPFKNEHEVVGRISLDSSAKTPEDVEGVDIFNIIDAELYRRYVVTPKNQLRLGYHKCTPEQNAAALWRFAEEYKSYNDVFQAGDMKLQGQWTPIGDSFANAFNGTYDGNGKYIEGLMIADKESTPSGLFGFARGRLTGINLIKPTVYGSHWAGAVAAVMYGTVSNCKVVGGEVVLLPNYEATRFDNGDKAGALVGYLSANGDGSDKITNNTVENVKVKAYRDVAALVGCANNIDAMSGNTIKGCSVIVDQITCSYSNVDPKNPNIGMLIGDLRATSDEVKAYSLANIKNNVISNSTLGQVVEKEGKTVTETIANVEVGSVGK